MNKQGKIPLVAFDFDHTIVNQNTDIEVQTVAPGGNIPSDVRANWDASMWTEYMRNVFQHLHSRSVTSNNILDRMNELTLTPGFEVLLSRLYNEVGAELIIISDSNSVFINHILEVHNLKKYFSAIYTNPAFWSDDGVLHIEAYHHQTHCDMSTVNMCKGDILKGHINGSKNEYSFISYVGDGGNDFCPMFRLTTNDLAFVRKDYTLVKFMEKQKRIHQREIKAAIFYWINGYEILSRILRKLD